MWMGRHAAAAQKKKTTQTSKAIVQGLFHIQARWLSHGFALRNAVLNCHCAAIDDGHFQNSLPRELCVHRDSMSTLPLASETIMAPPKKNDMREAIFPIKSPLNVKMCNYDYNEERKAKVSV